MKYPAERFHEWRMGERKSTLIAELRPVAKINGLPPSAIGQQEFFHLQTNEYHFKQDPLPRFIRFEDTVEGHDRAWDFLAHMAAERGDPLNVREVLHIEEKPRRYPFWKVKPLRKIKQLHKVVEAMVEDVEQRPATPQSGRVRASGKAPLKDAGPLEPIPYQIPEIGEPGPSNWVQRQEETARCDSGTTAEDDQSSICDEVKRSRKKDALRIGTCASIHDSGLPTPSDASGRQDEQMDERKASAISSWKLRNQQKRTVGYPGAATSDSEFLEPDPRRVRSFLIPREGYGDPHNGFCSYGAAGIVFPGAARQTMWRSQHRENFCVDIDQLQQPLSMDNDSDVSYLQPEPAKRPSWLRKIKKLFGRDKVESSDAAK